MYFAIEIIILLLLLAFTFWLVSMIISTMTRAPYVVTADNAIEVALKLAKPKPGELIYDLGCGDSRVLILSSKKYGTLGTGYDISPFCVWKSNLKVSLNKLSGDIKIYRQSLYKADLSKADIIFLYTGTEIMSQLEKTIFNDIKPTTRIVSIAFPFKNHIPAKTSSAKQLGKTTGIYLYTKSTD